MAGSPTVGTTFALAGAGRLRAGADKTVLGLGIGPTTVGLEWGPGALRFAWMTQPLPTAAFTGLRAGEIRGLSWEAFNSGTDGSLGVVRVLRSIWRGRIGEPKNSRSKASVPLIPQLNALLEQHRERSGNPAFGPIFANGAGKTC
jgi:hypothetical protein